MRRGECSEEIAIEILALWETDRPRLISSSLLARRALDLAFRFDHAVDDCIYIAAAIEYEAVLATADSRLERLARDVVAQVEAISD